MGLAARVTLVVLLVAVLLPALASACPLCKDAKSDTDYPGGTASLSSGFYYSILVMAAAPFLVVGGLIFRIALTRRRAAAASPAAEASAGPVPVSRLVANSERAQP